MDIQKKLFFGTVAVLAAVGTYVCGTPGEREIITRELRAILES